MGEGEGGGGEGGGGPAALGEGGGAARAAETLSSKSLDNIIRVCTVYALHRTKFRVYYSKHPHTNHRPTHTTT